MKKFNEIISILGAISIYLITTLGLSVKFYFIHLWILLVSLISIYLAFTIIEFGTVMIISLFLKNKKRRVGKKRNKLILFIFNHFDKYLIDMSGTKVKLKGLEKVPKDKKVMIVYNHNSNFDPMILAWYLRDTSLISISKPENFKIPICGPFMQAIDYIAINRDSAREGALTIAKAIKYINTDTYSICIAPEGTRNKTDEILLPFHSGSFKIATKTKCPIVVATETNTRQIHKNFPFKKTKVDLEITDVLYYDDYKDLTTAEISDNIRNMFLERLTKEE